MPFSRFAWKLTAVGLPIFEPSTSLGCKNTHPLTGLIYRIMQLTFREHRRKAENFLIPHFTHIIRQVFENPLPHDQNTFTPLNSFPLGCIISLYPCSLFCSLMFNCFCPKGRTLRTDPPHTIRTPWMTSLSLLEEEHWPELRAQHRKGSILTPCLRYFLPGLKFQTQVIWVCCISK